MNRAYNYSDIFLIPTYSYLESRSEADVSTRFLGRTWAGNWMPANMESVINLDIAKWLSFNNYFYIYHRFNGATKQLLQKARAEAWPFVSISIGVKQEDRELIQDIKNSKCRVDCVTIDIAHFNSVNGREMAKYVKQELPDVKLIGGNVADNDAVYNAAEWGCNAVKVGIGGGGICSTKNMTGFHVPMLTSALDCSRNLTIDIIFDGGVRENADIVKATWAGLSQQKYNYTTFIPMVMCGGLLAACIDAPGDNIMANISKEVIIDGVQCWQDTSVITHKRYWGSSSVRQKGGERKNVEGFETQITCNGLTIIEKYQEIKESVQSAISYSGGRNILALGDAEVCYVK